MTNNEVISVIVGTYNSSKFVIETLDSIKSQTYHNIELIVTDDCSVDETQKIVKIWVDNNKDRFCNVLIISSDKNTGIPANANRGLKAANGEWVKFLAGDDVLFENYCERAIAFAKENNADLLYAKIQPFPDNQENYELKTLVDEIDKRLEKSYYLYETNQFNTILKTNFIPAPSVIIKRRVYDENGGFDERFAIEDTPYWIKILDKGYRFHFLNETLVKYRIHLKSVSNQSKKNDGVIDINSHKLFKDLYTRLLFKIFLRRGYFSQLYVGFVRIVSGDIILCLGNSKTTFNKFVYYLLLLFTPLKLFKALTNKIAKYLNYR